MPVSGSWLLLPLGWLILYRVGAPSECGDDGCFAFDGVVAVQRKHQ